MADHLLGALQRGVQIVLLVPAIPEVYVYAARQNPAQRGRFDSLEALGRHPTFTVAGLAHLVEGRRRATYVHAKLMLVDDAWATIGSCNLHALSLKGHSEMNVSIWDPSTVRSLRNVLFARHLGRDTAGLDEVEALSLYATVARGNRARLERGDLGWEGAVFSFPPAPMP